MSQMQAEQPTTTYGEFKHEILNEISRCLNMPYNIAAANSSGYNYASGRLDHQTYYKAIRVDQAHLETVVLDRILAAWLDEAALVPGLIPIGVGPIASWPHQWFWDSHEHVDSAGVSGSVDESRFFPIGRRAMGSQVPRCQPVYAGVDGRHRKPEGIGPDTQRISGNSGALRVEGAA